MIHTQNPHCYPPHTHPRRPRVHRAVVPGHWRSPAWHLPAGPSAVLLFPPPRQLIATLYVRRRGEGPRLEEAPREPPSGGSCARRRVVEARLVQRRFPVPCCVEEGAWHCEALGSRQISSALLLNCVFNRPGLHEGIGRTAQTARTGGALSILDLQQLVSRTENIHWLRCHTRPGVGRMREPCTFLRQALCLTSKSSCAMVDAALMRRPPFSVTLMDVLVPSKASGLSVSIREFVGSARSPSRRSL